MKTIFKFGKSKKDEGRLAILELRTSKLMRFVNASLAISGRCVTPCKSIRRSHPSTGDEYTDAGTSFIR